MKVLKGWGGNTEEKKQVWGKRGKMLDKSSVWDIMSLKCPQGIQLGTLRK